VSVRQPLRAFAEGAFLKDDSMGLEALLVWLLVGAIAGWLASKLVRAAGMGLITNIVVGILGALLAGWLLPRLGFTVGGGLLMSIVHATIGAVVLLVVIGALRRV
jgi:uncharacterized membrane protein YeaQ/YmgE (transglycosylase-associated protein family)